jgi:rhodanese-related sulfurtransferase
MNTREFKDQIYQELGAVARALGNSHRLEIVELLAQGPAPVEYIAGQADISVASASQHLQHLKAARLVVARKKGNYRMYALQDRQVFEIAHAIRSYGFSRNAQAARLLDDFRAEGPELESMSAAELMERVKSGEVLLLDVRPRPEYEAGHIFSARSIPEDELAEKLRLLPTDREIIAYCRGPLCAMAGDAVKLLNDKGYTARQLDIGYPEWQMQGLPVEA